MHHARGETAGEKSQKVTVTHFYDSSFIAQKSSNADITNNFFNNYRETHYLVSRNLQNITNDLNHNTLNKFSNNILLKMC